MGLVAIGGTWADGEVEMNPSTSATIEADATAAWKSFIHIPFHDFACISPLHSEANAIGLRNKRRKNRLGKGRGWQHLR